MNNKRIFIVIAIAIGFYSCNQEGCNPIDKTPAKETCFDLLKNNNEFGIDCGGPCLPCDVIPEKELLINDLFVVNSDRKELSFKHLIESLAGKNDAGKLMLSFLNNFESDFELKNSIAENRKEGIKKIKDNWIKEDNFSGEDSLWIPNLENAPFRLLAITNRIDLKSLAQESAGEGRFTFCLVDHDSANRSPLTFNLIFEFNLPAKDSTECLQWLIDWHKLSNPKLTEEMYLDTLTMITEKFVSNNELNQIRTNDFELRRLWELREFTHNKEENTFEPRFLAKTPELDFDKSEKLRDFVKANQDSIRANNYKIPVDLQAASTARNNPIFSWDLNDVEDEIDDNVEFLFSLRSCNGCHNGDKTNSDKLNVDEDIDDNIPFLMFKPRNQSDTSVVADFIFKHAIKGRKLNMEIDLQIKDSIQFLSAQRIEEIKEFIEGH